MTEEATSAKEAIKDAKRVLAKTLAALAKLEIAATAAATQSQAEQQQQKISNATVKERTASKLDVGSKEKDLLIAAVYY